MRFALPPPEDASSIGNSPGNLKDFPQSARIFNVNSEKSSSQRPDAARRTSSGANSENFSVTRRFDRFRKDRLQNHWRDFGEKVEVPVSVSPGEVFFLYLKLT